MTLIEAIKARHSIRAYTQQPIEPEKVAALRQLIEQCNTEGRLNIQLVTNEPHAFGKSLLAHYGKFSNVSNYLVLAGQRADDLDERIGYYGELLVLEAERMGLNTCWVALTFKKIASAFTLNQDDALRCVISIGYGAKEGANHKIKRPDQVSNLTPDSPDWFRRGVAAALLAPTAINQQKFQLTLLPDNIVEARAKWGPYSKIDLGIVKYHFEVGAGVENFHWKDQ